MKIVIFDDNQEDLDALNQMITSWSNDKVYTDLIIRSFTESAYLDFILPDLYYWDVFFLDIMTSKAHDAGFKIAEKIHRENPSATIIFTTASLEFAESAFEISAFRYMLKPVSKEKLLPVLNHLYQSSAGSSERSAVFSGYDRKRILDFDKILYFQALTANHMANVYLTTGEKYEISLALTSFSGLLEKTLNNDFVRCHQSYIINMNHITYYSAQQVTLRNNVHIPISRHYKKSFTEAVIEHFKRTV